MNKMVNVIEDWINRMNIAILQQNKGELRSIFDEIANYPEDVDTCGNHVALLRLICKITHAEMILYGPMMKGGTCLAN